MTTLQDQHLENHLVAERHECDTQPQPNDAREIYELWSDLIDADPDKALAFQQRAWERLGEYTGHVGIEPVYFENMQHSDSHSHELRGREMRKCLRDWLELHERELRDAVQASA